MKNLRLLFLFLAACVGGARAEERLVTSPGKYLRAESKTSIEVASPDPDHLSYQIVFTSEWVDKATGRRLTGVRTIGSKEPLPVEREKWAFCFGSEGEVWLYLGKGSVCSYKSGASGVVMSATCSEPEIAERAPVALKAWIKLKEPARSPDSKDPSGRSSP